MKYIFTAMFFIVASISFAQVKVEGIVKDSIGNPLEIVNVVAINSETNGLESFAITNEAGKYRLDLKKNTKYKIQISSIGYKAISEILETKEKNSVKDFVLKEDNLLDEIQLTYDIPVKVDGDTITYNADSFKKPTDRKLGDLLKNLPGFEVNDAGEVKFEGKTIPKLMVDGKDFFEGDTKLGTKNIPSNAVDKVQLLRNFSEVDQLKGVQDNSDNLALNLKLKEGKKNFWFGDITAGAGTSSDINVTNSSVAIDAGLPSSSTLPGDNLHVFQPKLFYYSPKYSINLIGDLNNIGEVVLNRSDLFRFSSGFRAPSASSGTNIDLGNNDIGFLATQNNNALDVETNLGAANFTYTPKKSINISGFGIFSNNRTILRQNRFSQFVQFEDNPDTPIDESLNTPPDEATVTQTEQASDVGLLKLKGRYKPNARNQLEYNAQGRISKTTQNQDFFSTVTGNTDQFQDITPYSLKQSFNYYYTLNAKNIFAFNSQYLLQDEDPFYNAALENDPTNNDDLNADAFDATANNLGLNRDFNNYNLSQERRVKTNQFDAKLDYWNVLTDKSNINFTLGVISSRQDFDSNFFQLLGNTEDTDRNEFVPTPTINDGLISNDINYRFTDVYLRAHYQFITGIFTFVPGFNLHAYNINNRQFGEQFDDDFFRILPDFSARIKLKKTESINLRYNLRTQFNDVKQFARGLVLTNFNSPFSGNPVLENALSHVASINYSSFNQFNRTTAFGNITYTKSIDQVQSNVDFNSVIRTRTVFNSPIDNESIRATGSFEKRLRRIKGTVGGSFTYNRFNQLILGVPTINENYNQNYFAQIRTNFINAPNIQFRYTYSAADNNQGGRNTKFFTNTPSVEFDAYIFKALTFRTDYSYTRISDEDETLNSFDFWNATLSYRKNSDSKLEYEIRATNLLNTRSRDRNSVSNFSSNFSQTFIQPRYITFRLRYDL
ncbi:carboxypeptidase regulatory-like domain-containing protein [Winogradskyella immobilis]|uniref:Carboxypeptidase regulatory-like domain-containing protein n=1 Tax=Winogradskyella immobilis TaxID=2816852 RepID=A0ABS8ENE8_9FLAO|nr:carboxypeptidase regulatory-like domain-containing protein [Winogradskyella immobilis]MCC1483822.1 carboxypeptidase regulatory-like domain-containing protein [Winogradskyella immobilis]MCG0015916.1 carboxypeptidase regulatory-like domain-containing protein [Winogradskyella immobilis]